MSCMMFRLGYKLQDEHSAFRRNKAAVELQRVIRGWLTRKRVVAIAQEMYVKCVDGDVGHVYWFNNVSEQSFWQKPSLLREFDCGEAVMMPPAEEVCSTPCQGSSCHRSATIYCSDCDGVLCGTCSHQTHKEGRMRFHTLIRLTTCAQCGFQLATRFCRSCGDHYCDSCFKWVHRKGRLTLHTASWVCDRCDVCEQRAAWLGLSDPAEEFKATVFCRVCFTQSYGDVDPLTVPHVFELQYLGPAVHVANILYICIIVIYYVC